MVQTSEAYDGCGARVYGGPTIGQATGRYGAEDLSIGRETSVGAQETVAVPTGATPKLALSARSRDRTVKQVRNLPYDDPGTPDLRSPARYLIWTARQQWRPLLLGTGYGIAWMGAQALVPAAIGRGLDEGVSAHDMSAAVKWSLVVLLLATVQAVAGVLRHRIAVQNWLNASFRSMQLLGRH
ncbi:MAG: hypothetical protein QOH75_3822, partial [Actinomycetota bacterium]|nr:hypothetical protein [Actinomycetota bacterium]